MHPMLQTLCNKRALVTAIIVLFAGSVVASLSVPTPSLRTKNIFHLTFLLGTTTNQMVKNTANLSDNVDQVKAKLGQLNNQETILREQAATSRNLNRALNTQVELTSHGVNLMKQILTNERASAVDAQVVAIQTTQLTNIVGTNTGTLSRVVGSLGISETNSQTLSRELDDLITQLNASLDEFKVFGQLHGIISGLTKGTGLSGITSGVTNGISGLTNGTQLSGPVGGILSYLP